MENFIFYAVWGAFVINGSEKILIIQDNTIITGLQEQWLGESHFSQIAIGFAIKGLIKLRNMHYSKNEVFQ